MMQELAKALLATGVVLMTMGNSAAGDTKPGLTAEDRLAPCPASPNCVSSDMSDRHGIAALDLIADPTEAWNALHDYLAGQPHVKIKVNKTDYLHAEFRTRLLRFVDDVEFHLRAEQGQIAMRSASRLGYSDLGANRRRLESVRAGLAAAGIVKPAD